MPTLLLGVSARFHAYHTCIIILLAWPVVIRNSNCNWTSWILFWAGNVNSSLQLLDIRCQVVVRVLWKSRDRCNCCCGTSGRRDLRCALATRSKLRLQKNTESLYDDSRISWALTSNSSDHNRATWPRGDVLPVKGSGTVDLECDQLVPEGIEDQW